MAELSCCGEELDRLVHDYLLAAAGSGEAASLPPPEAARHLILAGDFGGAAQRLASLCPALAENQWLQFQLKRHNFLLLAARATAPTSGSGGSDDSPEARAQQLQQALELAKKELAPLALHAYCEAYSDFKHCMLALLSGGGGSSAADADSDLRQFAGMVARALRQELAASGGAAPTPPPQLLQLLRYLLLLHKHQHHGGFHPYWWPKISAASQALCGRLLQPGRDALPPPELDTGVQDSFGGPPSGVRETDVQALRTSLGCDREEAVTLLRRSRGSASRALQDALQAVHIDEQLLRQLAEEYGASRGLEPLPASSAAEGSEEEMQTDAQQQQGDVQQQAVQQQVASPGKAERLRQSKVGSKRSAAAAAEGEGEAGGRHTLELPAELSEHQLRRVMRRLERLLSAGQADEALQELEAADPALLPDHPTAAFALHRCRFLQHLSGGGGTAAALAVVRQDLSPLAQQEPELQPQLKAALALLLPLPATSAGGDAAALKRQQQGVADALAALRAALRPRCHVREPQLLVLLRELLSLHQAHFKLQRCQDRFATELGLSALKASDPTPASAGTAGGAAAARGGGLVAAAIAAEAQEALAAVGEVPVPGVRVLTSDSEGDEMDEDSEDEEEEFAEDGAGVPESAIVTVCEFTGLPRHTAIELLLVHGGDPAAVLAQMFP